MLDNIYGVLFNPQLTFPELSNRKYLGSSFLIILMLSIITALKNSVVYNSSSFSFFILFVLTFIMYLFIWVISGVFLSFTADLFGGEGKVTNTLIGTAYASLPLIFIAPLYILTNAMGETGEHIFSLLRVIIYLWSFTLIVTSLKFSNKFHVTNAILSFVSVFILMIIFSIGIGAISVLGTIFAITTLS